MASPIAPRRAAAVVGAPAAAGWLLPRGWPWPAYLGLAALWATVVVVLYIVHYLIAKAAIAKSDSAHVSEVVAAVNGHPARPTDLSPVEGGAKAS